MNTESFKSPRFIFLLASLVLAFAISSTTNAAPSAQYAYPFSNQYLSTLTSAVSRANSPGKMVRLEVRQDRRHLPLLEKRNILTLRLFQQPKPAPLMFVIPGVGGHPTSGSAMVLAETYFEAGYSVVTLPSNMSWQYAVAVSETAVPGYMPRDAKEYYSFLKLVASVVERKHGVRTTGYAISGVSLGGLLTAFLAEEDLRQGAFNFQKIVLVNPAVDVAHGIKVLDTMYAAGDAFTPQYKQSKMALLIGVGESLLNAPLSPQTFAKVSPKLSNLSDADMTWVIGSTFRDSIRDIIVAGQRVHNTGLLKSKATRFQQDSVFAEAESYSFTDYMNLVVFPSIQDSQKTRAEILAESSLYRFEGMLKNNSKIYVVENEDDFIVTKNDLGFLKGCLGTRLVSYPHGGHLGNLWFDQNRRDLKRIVAPAL